MTDVFSKTKRSAIMSRIKCKGTSLERRFLKQLSSQLYPAGIRYRINYKGLPGKPDIVFVAKKTAIFLDGDFWHGYKMSRLNERLPKKYWRGKIEANIRRDKKINRKLSNKGWRILRFWEHDLKRHPEKVVAKIIGALAKRQRLRK